MSALAPLPAQPVGVPWPTAQWAAGELPASVGADALDGAIGRLLGPDQDPAVGHTNAVAVVHRGRIVAERYGEREMGPLAELAGATPGPLGPDELLYSWSMAKSVCHLAVGIAAERGALDPVDPAPVPQWQRPGDPRAAITWDHLLQMRAGLAWTEVYEGFAPDAIPDVVQMLFGPGAGDVAAFAADRPLVAEPGSLGAYTYSSGTTNIVAAALQRVLGGLTGDELGDWLVQALFAPIGVTSASLGHDTVGTWVGSSYLEMTARDWLRLGLLVLRGGTWDGVRVVPSAWIDHGRTPRSPDEDVVHGAHWWCRPDRDDGTFGAHGFEGQRLLLVPGRDLIVFRQGKTAADQIPALNAHLMAVIDLFPAS